MLSRQWAKEDDERNSYSDQSYIKQNNKYKTPLSSPSLSVATIAWAMRKSEALQVK